MTDFGRKVRERREALGMTQEVLAEKLGYKTKSSIAKIESGVNDPVLSKVSDFAEALNVPISFFLGWEETRPILTAEDAVLIKKYHLLNNDNKKVVNDMIASLLSVQTSI